MRTVLRAELNGPENGMLKLVIEAEGFLRHMVRNIVGTVVDAGLDKMDVSGFKEILE